MSKKILVIEDETSVRENIMELLEAEGFDAIGAEDGRQGVHVARESVPDLIVCDVMMPEVDGYEVLQTLRSDTATTTIPFIFLTAKATKADQRQGMDLGADDYLTKPFTRSELLGAIATRLEKQALLQERYNNAALNQAKDTLDYLAYYDALTKLPNRRFLQEHLTQILTNTRQEIVPILCIGLDRFSRINDNMGFDFGDLLLRSVAERLTSCVGGNGILARLNSAYFAIIPVSITQRQDTVDFAQLLLDILGQPFILEGYEIFLSASIGITFSNCEKSNSDSPIKQAEAAMYDAKTKGGNNYQFYTKDKMNLVSVDQLALETELRYAMERAELEVYYQPQVDLRSGEIIGAEALIRWHHPERGMVSPATFIPLAEETGLIIPIGEWVLRTACEQTRLWQAAGFSSLRMAVNLSSYQLKAPDISKKIGEIITESKLDPEFLELELTESIIVQNAEEVNVIFKELKTLGVKIAIDDFGTGYSSLGYLQQFAFDILKIDKSFVRDITNEAKNATITIALIQMARGLNLTVVAEGVETEAEKAFLCQHQCDVMQGYLFSRPIPAKEFEKMLSSGKRLKIKIA